MSSGLAWSPPLAPLTSTRLQAKAQVNQIQYGKYKLDHVLAVAHVANGKVHADIDSKNQYLTGLVSLDALTNSKKLEATLVAELSEDLCEAMVGINEQEIALLMAERGK